MTVAQARSQEGVALTCVVPAAKPSRGSELVRPLSANETQRLHNAPHGARRIGKHRLEVAWVNGKKVFTDKPPYNEPLDGIWWAYCGYDAKLGVHLLVKQDNGLFTGALLDDQTGVVLSAGQGVMFSPDAKRYLAYEQPDGQDGETLKLYTRNGTLLWKGFNGLVSRDGISVVADFERVDWDAQNRPRATGRLGSGKAFTVTLTPGNDGKWEWLPHVE
jgi:hypothetical protein